MVMVMVMEKSKAMMHKTQNDRWDNIIDSNAQHYSFKISLVWKYKDLLLLFVRRDLVSLYKQTILGPLWFLIQPLMTTLIYVFIFGNVAKLSTDGIPHTLFYLSGVIIWTYFADCVTQTSGTFTKNAALFGKVYFPRVITPLSISITNLIKLGIQMLLLFVIGFYYQFYVGTEFSLNITLLGFPFLVILMAIQGLGFGLLVSALTTKYRDLQYLVQFAVQLAMYASTVIFPLSTLEGNFKTIIALNPMSPIIESFRYMFFSTGEIPFQYLLISTFVSMVLFIFSVLIFNKVEKNFMDTV